MGDWAIEEIYLMLEQAFLQGASRATLAAYPFMPTDENLSRMRGHRWEGFWKIFSDPIDCLKEQSARPTMLFFAVPISFRSYPLGTNSRLGYPT